MPSERGNQADAHEETLVSTADYPAASTPSRVRNVKEAIESPIPTRSNQQVSLLPRVANAPPWLRKPKDPRYDEGSIKSYKYVDDNVNTSKVNMKKARLLDEGGTLFKEVIDTRTQDLLTHVAKRAADIGMAINADKTGLMLMSAATSFDARTRLTVNGRTVLGSNTLKLLGVHLDSDMSFRTHIDKLASKMRSKTWALAKLKKRA